jgi:anti-sigma regulatory factor (Ser/Thr protein kinase)
VEVACVLGAGPTAPAEARRSLRVLDSSVSPDQLADVRLVVSELVTNAVVHGGLDLGEPISMTVQIAASRIRVEIVDRGRGFTEAPGRPANRQGWGLSIVDQLAERWGTERGAGTKVWAEFRLRA